MRYRVRGPLHSDALHIATELRGFIAHTGPIRLGYLQMHGVAAHTIDVSDAGAAFFEETVLPKIGAAGSFVEQRTALRQPKELKLAATLCPTTATTLPNLTEWAGVWSEVLYGPRHVTVRLRCLPEDAERLCELETQGWRVLRGPMAALSRLRSPVPFAPQFWPSRAGCAAAPAALPAAPAAMPALVPAVVSPLTASEILAQADSPSMLLGVTPTGQGVRLAWRAMTVAVQDGGARQDSVLPALVFRALSQGMGALVIAERSKVTPRAMAFMAKRLRLIDMADPWESARIPWRSLSLEGLKLLVGSELPSPLPETLADTLRAAGRRNLATPVLEALTREPAHDLAGTLEAGGGVVLLVEPGATASFLASLLILNLSLARMTRPLLVCRPASLPIPPALSDRAVQIVFGETPTAALELRAVPNAWEAHFPDGQKLTLQENLAAAVEEQAGVDHAALMNGLQGRGWTPEESAAFAAAPAAFDADTGLDWPEGLEAGDEEVVAGLSEADEPPVALGDEKPALVADNDVALVSLGWPEGLEAGDEGASLGWPEGLEADDEEAAAGLPEADDPPAALVDEAIAPVAADEGVRLIWPEEPGESDTSGEAPMVLSDDTLTLLAEDDEEAAGLPEAGERPTELGNEERDLAADADLSSLWQGGDDFTPDGAAAWPVSLLDDEAVLTDREPAHQSRRRLLVRRRGRVTFTPGAGRAAASVVNSVSDDTVGAGLSEANELFDERASLGWPVGLDTSDVEGAAELADADEVPLEMAPALDKDDGLGWPDDLDGEELAPGAVDESENLGWLVELDAGESLGWPDELGGEELALVAADEGDGGLAEADETPLKLALAPDEDAAPVPVLVAADAGDTGLAEANGLARLVTAWRNGESLMALARELRRGQPSLSLLEATQVLKAAIQSEGEAAPPQLQLAPAAPVQPDRLVALLRGLAAVEPEEPVAKEALRRWREGGQRRLVVRDLAEAYRLKEADARSLYDRVVFPHIISDLNGSAGLVVDYLRGAGSEPQAALPPVIVDCATRLLGNTSPHASKARALLPVMRELLATLDDAGSV